MRCEDNLKNYELEVNFTYYYIQGNGNVTLRLCFDGDSEVYEVPKSKAIKYENSTTRAALSRNGATGKTSRGTGKRSPLGPLSEPPHKKARGSDDGCTTDDSDPAENFNHNNLETPYYRRGSYSVLEKKMRNYRSILLERYNSAHRSTLLNV